jgi:hypothetical protein
MNTTADSLDPTTNSAIVTRSTRQLHGLLLQGDTLHSMYRRTNTALAALELVAQQCE